MPFVAPWSGAAPGSCFSEVRVFDTFVAIFVQAMRRRAPTQVHPISPGRRLPSGRQLSLKCIPSRLALSFRLALPLHRHLARNLFPRTSRWLLLEEPCTVSGLHCSLSDGVQLKRLIPAGSVVTR